MTRRLQSLLFFVLIAGMLLALWSWSDGGPRPALDGGPLDGMPLDGAPLDGGPQAQASVAAPSRPAAGASSMSPTPSLPAFLPPEAIDTLRLIVRDGPFPYRQDGSVFQNRERRLPQQPRGYYREYTVETPGSPDRGARRIVTGGEVGAAPPVEYHYTADHYRSFRRFEVDPAQLGAAGSRP